MEKEFAKDQFTTIIDLILAKLGKTRESNIFREVYKYIIRWYDIESIEIQKEKHEILS